MAGAGALCAQSPGGPCIIHMITPEPSEDPQIHAQTPGPDLLRVFVFPMLCMLYLTSPYRSHVALPPSRVLCGPQGCVSA